MNKIIAFFKTHYYLLTSLLMFFSFPSYEALPFRLFPLFAWVALVPLFNYVRGKGAREVYTSSFIAGLIGNFLAFEWIGNFGAAATGGYTVIVAFLISILTVYFSIKIALAEFISRRFESLRVLVFPSVWVAVDWIASIGFLAYPLPFWGYSQYPFIPFIQMASLTGVMGITFVVILFNYLLAEFFAAGGFAKRPVRNILRMREARRIAILGAFVLVVSACGGGLLYVNNGRTGRDLRVAMIQSCISPWENWSVNRFRYLAELKRQTGMSMGDNPDLIIWSESATLETISYDYETGNLNEFEMEVLSLARNYERPILTGEIGVTEETSGPFINRYPQNNAVLIDRSGEVVKTYAKIHLVPFGEWFPYEKWLPFVKRIAAGFWGSSFVPGDRPVLFEVEGRRFGVLVCYEGIFHRLCREYRRMGADYFINITNDGWTDTYRGHMQHFSASIFRAVENGVWYLRAGNTGYTASIDPFGRVRKSIPILKRGYLAADLDFSLNRRTVYTIIGDLFLYIAMAFVAVLALIIAGERVRARRGKSTRE
ncbi:MAG: apolipoprotein N-acyltransferase [Chrysiogenales bacterium]|nr:MAG: apolipoprotein N-acyltransferase [Chrysiogenales bacterium]